MRKVGLFTVVILSGGILGGVIWFLQVDSAPGEETLTTALELELPVWWSVSAITIVATEKYDREQATIYRQRFEAKVMPREDLITVAEDGSRIGPFRMAHTTIRLSDTYILYGVATSGVSGERISIQFVFDNSVAGLGAPRSFFNEPILLEGSERASQVKMELSSALRALWVKRD